MERKTIEKCSFFPCFSIYFRSFLLFIWEKRFFFFSGNNLFLGEFFRIVSCLLGKHIFRRFFSRELFFFRRSFFFFLSGDSLFFRRILQFYRITGFSCSSGKKQQRKIFSFAGESLKKNQIQIFFFFTCFGKWKKSFSCK